MDISYANKQILKICNDEKTARKEIGIDGTKVLTKRLQQLRIADNLEALRNAVGHYHELTGDRKGQIACNLGGLNRLILMSVNDPRPVKPDGGLDWSRVTAIEIVAIVDYH